MTDELDEWILDELASAGVGGQHVHDTVVRIHEAQPEDDARLVDDVQTAKARNTLVPNTCEELLHVRVRHKRLLLAFYGKFQSLKCLVMPWDPLGVLAIIIEHHF